MLKSILGKKYMFFFLNIKTKQNNLMSQHQCSESLFIVKIIYIQLFNRMCIICFEGCVNSIIIIIKAIYFKQPPYVFFFLFLVSLRTQTSSKNILSVFFFLSLWFFPFWPISKDQSLHFIFVKCTTCELRTIRALK